MDFRKVTAIIRTEKIMGVEDEFIQCTIDKELITTGLYSYVRHQHLFITRALL